MKIFILSIVLILPLSSIASIDAKALRNELSFLKTRRKPVQVNLSKAKSEWFAEIEKEEKLYDELISDEIKTQYAAPARNKKFENKASRLLLKEERKIKKDKDKILFNDPLLKDKNKYKNRVRSR